MPHLMITRKVGTTFWIGDTCITINEIVGKQAKIHIDADPGVKVLRGELRGNVRKPLTWHKKKPGTQVPK